MIAASTFALLHPQPPEKPLAIEVVQDDGQRHQVTGLRRVRPGVYDALMGDRVVGSVHATEEALARAGWSDRIEGGT